MYPILALFPILGLALAWKSLTGRGCATGITLSVSSIVIILFISGLAGLLQPISKFLWISGTIILCLYIWKDRNTLQRHLDLPLVLWTGLAVLFLAVHHNAYFGFYDELSHWGIFVKELYYNDAFWTDGPHIRHPRYVPGPALWTYFVISPFPYSEGSTYFAQFLFLTAPLMLFFERLSWRQCPWAILILGWLAYGLANWGHGIADLHADHIISTWFVGIVLMGIYYSTEKHLPWLIILPLCTLVLIKDAGLFFSVGTAGIILLWSGIKSWQNKGFDFSRLKPLALWFACAIALPIIFVACWKMERAAQDITRASGTIEGMYDKLIADRTEMDSGLKRTIDARFWEVVFTEHISKGEPSRGFNVFNYVNKEIFTSKVRLLPLPMSTALFIVLYSLAALLIIAMLRPRTRDWLPWTSVYACLLIMTLFIIGVLHNHYTTSPGIGGQTISSYMRYVHSMLLPLAMLIIVPLLPVFNKHNKNNQNNTSRTTGYFSSKAAMLTLGLVILSFYVLDPPYLKPYIQPKTLNSFRAQTMPATQTLIRSLPENSRIWVHFPRQDNRFLAWNLQYQLTPLVSYVNNDDPEFLNKPASKIIDEWKEYDYIWFVMQRDKDRAWLDFVMGDDYSGKNLISSDQLISRLETLSD